MGQGARLQYCCLAPNSPALSSVARATSQAAYVKGLQLRQLLCLGKNGQPICAVLPWLFSPADPVAEACTTLAQRLGQDGLQLLFVWQQVTHSRDGNCQAAETVVRHSAAWKFLGGAQAADWHMEVACALHSSSFQCSLSPRKGAYPCARWLPVLCVNALFLPHNLITLCLGASVSLSIFSCACWLAHGIQFLGLPFFPFFSFFSPSLDLGQGMFAENPFLFLCLPDLSALLAKS